MTVYVDELRNTAPNRRWPYKRSCHLVADTVDELHDFATRLGMKRAWFQDGRYPHYDIVASRRVKALRMGARVITARGWVIRHYNTWRKRRD